MHRLFYSKAILALWAIFLQQMHLCIVSWTLSKQSQAPCTHPVSCPVCVLLWDCQAGLFPPAALWCGNALVNCYCGNVLPSPTCSHFWIGWFWSAGLSLCCNTHIQSMLHMCYLHRIDVTHVTQVLVSISVSKAKSSHWRVHKICGQWWCNCPQVKVSAGTSMSVVSSSRGHPHLKVLFLMQHLCKTTALQGHQRHGHGVPLSAQHPQNHVLSGQGVACTRTLSWSIHANAIARLW